MGSYLLEELKKIEGVLNPRGVGCLLAFDLETQELRDRFATRCIDNNLIVNTAEENTIRLRPNLNVSYNECTEALAIIESAIQY
jgi:L-lysine 6-transaminase